MPFPPLDVSANSTLIESLAPSGDAASQSGVWGLPARALSNSWARGRLRRAAIDGLMIKLRLARDCFDCSIPLSWQLVRQSIASNYPLLQIQASKPRTRISYHYCWVESKGCEVSVGMTRRCAGTVSDQAPPYSFLSPLWSHYTSLQITQLSFTWRFRAKHLQLLAESEAGDLCRGARSALPRNLFQTQVRCRCAIARVRFAAIELHWQLVLS